MTRQLKLLASLLTLATVGILQAAPDAKPFMPVITIQQVEAKDATTYAMWIARNNEVAKAKLGAEHYYRVYLGQAAGEDTGMVFSVTAADSFVTMNKNAQILSEDPALVESRTHLAAIRELGAQTVLKAVRYEGTNAGAFLFNTQALVTDEAAYLKALDGLRALLDSHDLKDIKVNAYRVMAGRTTYTHLISINAPSAERRAVLMDALANEPWVAEWLASIAKYRTVVRNGTYREITR
jgi:hypothetical protein